MQSISSLADDFLSLWFPNLCAACAAKLYHNEKVICSRCLHALPKTNFHRDKENPVASLFWGRVKIEHATAFYYFSKGSRFRKLIHKLKYEGQHEIGYELGLHFGASLKDSWFSKSTCIVPVPLHPSKERKRGYNQSEMIARGMSDSLGIPLIIKNLVRDLASSTQTRKSRYDRWQNVENIFSVRNREKFSGEQILLVDDVITTGSTIEACANELLKADNTNVGVASLAVA